MSKKTKNQINLSKVIRGTLYQKYFKCRNKQCSCQKGAKIHGPHFYISYSTDTHSKNIYIQPLFVKIIQTYIDNYNHLWEIIKKKSKKNLEKIIKLKN